MTIYIVMEQTGWDSDDININAVFAVRKDAFALQTKILQEWWDEFHMGEVKWPGKKKALEKLSNSGAYVWVEMKRVRK